MGLADWQITLGTGTPQDDGLDAYAAIAVQRESSSAEIVVSPLLFGGSASDQRQYLTHELVHIHLAPLDWSAADTAAGLSVRARRLAEAVWEQRSERACDDLARVIAPRLPLPPWVR